MHALQHRPRRQVAAELAPLTVAELLAVVMAADQVRALARAELSRRPRCPAC